jgi:GntR family transcriptional repressor for pyruvate dehydrogenase complex
MERPGVSDNTEILGRISRQDLHVETTTRLARLVASSPPGSRLPTEKELCERLGVGRSTLREAIRSLAFLGVVQARQGSGTYVTPPEEQAIEKLIGLGLTLQRVSVGEVIEARRALEVEAVRMAAQRATEQDRAVLRRLMEQMARDCTDLAEASRNDVSFHVLLARASHNVVLIRFIYGMRAMLEGWITKAVTDAGVVAHVVEEHDAVLDAVFARDADRAAALMYEHLTRAADRLYQVVGRDQSTADHIALLLDRLE